MGSQPWNDPSLSPPQPSPSPSPTPQLSKWPEMLGGIAQLLMRLFGNQQPQPAPTPMPQVTGDPNILPTPEDMLKRQLMIRALTEGVGRAANPETPGPR